MDGVVVFADNKVLEVDSFENQLFNKLKEESSYSVLPICCIQDLESTIKAISTFKAIILDWNFENNNAEDEELEGVVLPNKTPEQFLNVADIYSLIYIYSTNEIGAEIKTKLQARYNHKVKFKQKAPGAIGEDAAAIIKDIKDFEDENKHMAIPFIWSHAINQSVQRIFYDLENANKHWVKEIKDTVLGDGGDPTSELIEIFHNLLNESLIQDETLRKELEEYNPEQHGVIETNTVKLYRRIFYTLIPQGAPLMTGYIFKLSDEEFGILITPECDIASRKKDGKTTFEFLVVNKKESKEYQESKKKKFQKDPGSINNIFNNGVISRHVLASFPFDETVYSDIALINFTTALQVIKEDNDESLLAKRYGYKLNSPYIHQLRQRYIAFIGRFGVPALPNSIRSHYWQ